MAGLAQQSLGWQVPHTEGHVPAGGANSLPGSFPSLLLFSKQHSPPSQDSVSSMEKQANLPQSAPFPTCCSELEWVGRTEGVGPRRQGQTSTSLHLLGQAGEGMAQCQWLLVPGRAEAQICQQTEKSSGNETGRQGPAPSGALRQEGSSSWVSKPEPTPRGGWIC